MDWVSPFSPSALSLGECQCITLAQHEAVEVMPPINPYEILHLRRDANTAEIKKAFRRLGLLHHPGRRACTDEEEQLRKLQLFDLLAAAYETLVDKEARRKYDCRLNAIINRKYTKGLAGEMFVGGKRVGTKYLLAAGSIPEPVVPELVRSDSASTFSSVASNESLDDLLLSPLESTKSHGETSSLMDSEYHVPAMQLQAIQVSEEEKEIMLGGLLRDLYIARDFKPFSDSLDIFEKVFGSKVFDAPCRRMPMIQQPGSWDDIKSLSSYAGWEGSTKISPDGRTRVFTTSRILYDRKVTRIETFTDDPRTGARTKSTTVTSEPIRKKDVVEEEEHRTCLTICGGSPKLEKKKSDEEPLLDKSEDETSYSSCYCKDLLYSYYEICSQLCDDLRMARVGYINML